MTKRLNSKHSTGDWTVHRTDSQLARFARKIGSVAMTQYGKRTVPHSACLRDFLNSLDRHIEAALARCLAENSCTADDKEC